MEAVKAALDAAGLQCSEVEADTSSLVITGQQLDHESGILSLEASRIWRLRHGLEFAARQKQLTGDQVVKLIAHITWNCLLRRLALSLITAGYRFARTFGSRSGRLWSRNSDGLRHCCRSSRKTLPVLGHRGSMLRMPLVEHVGAMELHVAGVIQWLLRRQAAVRSDGGFLRRSSSALDDQFWSNMNAKCKKPVGLESKTYTKLIVLICIPLWLVTCRRIFRQCLMIELSSKMYHRPSYSPSLLGASCSEVSGGNRWKSCGERAKLTAWDCVMLVGLLKSWGNGCLFLLDNMALVLGASKGRGSAPNLNHTCREICVISLATFTILVCRWIASEDNPADEPSRSKRYRPSMHSDIDQCGTTTAGSSPDSELFAVLSAEAARVAGEETQSRKLSRVRSCAGTEACPRTTRGKRSSRCSGESGLSALPRQQVVLPRAEPSHRSHGSVPHSHAQRVS